MMPSMVTAPPPLPAEFLWPLESSEFISGRSVDVNVNVDKLEEASEFLWSLWQQKPYDLKEWKNDLHPRVADDRAAEWVFVIDTLNFSFWTPENEPQFAVEYKGTIYHDYQALCACINRALDEGIPITEANFYAEITLEQIRHIFRSCTSADMPLLEERRHNLRQVGQELCKHFDGHFVNLLKTASGSAAALLSMIVRHFPCYRDFAEYGGRYVAFLKRAQILVADIWACFENQGLGHFVDIDSLTMFADYRVPQVLRYLGTLTFSDDLNRLVNTSTQLVSGSQVECEIRGCSIWAVELLRRKLVEKHSNSGQPSDCGTRINNVLLDFLLWDFATACPMLMSSHPEHRTRSIFY